jgi:methylenetetrahydrofolate reductase (NADPH)
MKPKFKEAVSDHSRFVVTLELVPGPESQGRSVAAIKTIAEEALRDGRIDAVTITDNPGGNPALSPDVLGKEILDLGMDVIVHFTCRDLNRAGIESRALQLGHLGIKNILALNGDYSGQGFGGQAAPVFDVDSVNLTCMFNMLGQRIASAEDPSGFFLGGAVSPFKQEEGECFAQYFKLCKKSSAGARYVITQLGYDARKFQELLQMYRHLGSYLPTLGSVYFLTPKIARIIHENRIPGAVVTRELYDRIRSEWQDPGSGRKAAIERSARLAAVLKGLGYRGIHLGGVHWRFETIGKILDRMAEIEQDWRQYIKDFDFPQKGGFYIFKKDPDTQLSSDIPNERRGTLPAAEKLLFTFLKSVHHAAFRLDAFYESHIKKVCAWLDRRPVGHLLMGLTEDPIKKLLLSCKKCGDCGIQHLAFLCPESQCPKHIRNGACGGSRNGMCEVYPDRKCVWVRVYHRLASINRQQEMAEGCVPPRMWELDQTSAWFNFHLGRDHQTASCAIAEYCSDNVCSMQRIRRKEDPETA